MSVKKIGGTFLIAIVVGFYTTFVAQTLWNWFVVSALGVPMISYWGMFGLTMLFGLVLAHTDIEAENEQRWNGAYVLMNACVPLAKREETAALMKTANEGLWLAIGVKVFGKATGNTATLGMGWAIHTFFISN